MIDKDIKKKRNKYFVVLGKTLAIIVLLLLIASIILPDKELSESEKRALAGFPELNSYSVFSGSFSSDFEEYASDQIAGRNVFVKLFAVFNSLMGADCSNGVYSGKDGYLIEKMTVNSTDNVADTIYAINVFASKFDGDTTFVMVPNAVSIYGDKLPAYAVTESQTAWSNGIKDALEGVNYINLAKDLEGKEKVYYKTDHHWTIQGAMYSVLTVLDALKHDVGGADGYYGEAVCNNFIGSLASKSGFTPYEADTIYIVRPTEETNYIVTNMSTKQKSTSIYDISALESIDPYTVFLGGNAGRINIVTEKSEGGKLLVFKDSYFNCFLPFLIDRYKEIDIIDPRYYYDDISMLLKEKQYDEVLFFYNMNTFVNDTSLKQVLEVAVNE